MEMSDVELLFHQYYNYIFCFILSKTNCDVTLSEEVTQETFYQVYRSIHRYRPNASIKTWMSQIALHVLWKYQKKHRREITGYDFSLVSAPKIRDDIEDSVKAAIQTLDEQSQQIVISRLYFQTPYQEIAKQWGIGESSAKVIYHRAKLQLQSLLREVYEYERNG